MINLFLWISLLACLWGCASPRPLVPAVNRTDMSVINDGILDVEYAAERAYRRNNNQPIKLGLALSGGGSKAAMFSHGVLHGLHNAGILEHVDAISTVSGGGYTAYWYFSKLLEAENGMFKAVDIFEDCMPEHWTAPARVGQETRLSVAMQRAVMLAKTEENRKIPGTIKKKCTSAEHYEDGDPFRWQAHIVRWPDVFGTEPVYPDGSKQSLPKRELNQGLLDGLFLEPVKQAWTHKSSIPDLYQWGIERTWGLNPDKRVPTNPAMSDLKWTYSNGVMLRNGGSWRVDPEKASWQALRSLYDQSGKTKGGGPLPPLWIVNANAGSKGGVARENMKNNFEMTAFGSGGENFGYVDDIVTLPIPALGTSVRASAGFADAQGLTSWKSKIVQFLSNIWPGARWGVPVTVSTKSGTTASIRLSDGGGSENLGVYSLLKRGVQDIIVVDAAQDVVGDMSDLCDLKSGLADSHITLDFPNLKDFAEVCAGKRVYNVSDWPSPVVKGTAKWNATGRVSRIWLIKAAWDQRAVADTYNSEKCGEQGEADCLLTVFYGHNTSVGVHGLNGGGENMAFPQLPTAGSTANASSYLIWGYRELGRSIARELVWDEQAQTIDLPRKVCPVKSYPKLERGDRPYPLRPNGSLSSCASES